MHLAVLLVNTAVSIPLLTVKSPNVRVTWAAFADIFCDLLYTLFPVAAFFYYIYSIQENDEVVPKDAVTNYILDNLIASSTLWSENFGGLCISILTTCLPPFMVMSRFDDILEFKLFLWTRGLVTESALSKVISRTPPAAQSDTPDTSDEQRSRSPPPSQQSRSLPVRRTVAFAAWVLLTAMIGAAAADLYLRQGRARKTGGPCHGICAWPRFPVMDTATPFGGDGSSCSCVIVAAATCNATSTRSTRGCTEDTACNATSDEVNEVIDQNLDTLFGLSFRDCPFVERIDNFPYKLKEIKLNDNAALNYLPAAKLWNLTQLRVLEVKDNGPDLRVPFKGGEGRLFDPAKSLTISKFIWQNIVDNGTGGLAGEIPAGLVQLPHIELIKLVSQTHLTGELPRHWTATKLATFVMDGSNTTQCEPYSRPGQQSQPYSPSSCGLGGTLPPLNATALPSLRFFQVPWNQLQGAVPASWSSFTEICMIDLRGNTLLTGGSATIGAIENIDDSMARNMTWPRKTPCTVGVLSERALNGSYYGFNARTPYIMVSNPPDEAYYTGFQLSQQEDLTPKSCYRLGGGGGSQKGGGGVTCNLDAVKQSECSVECEWFLNQCRPPPGGGGGGGTTPGGGTSPGCKFNATTQAECPETDKCMWNDAAKRCQGKQTPGGDSGVCTLDATTQAECTRTTTCVWDVAAQKCQGKDCSWNPVLKQCKPRTGAGGGGGGTTPGDGGGNGTTPGCKFDATMQAECPETDKCTWNDAAQRCQGKLPPGDGGGGTTPGCKFDATTQAECPETDKCTWNDTAQRCQGKQSPGGDSGGCNSHAKALQDCPETSTCKWNDATKLCEAKSGSGR